MASLQVSFWNNVRVYRVGGHPTGPGTHRADITGSRTPHSHAKSYTQGLPSWWLSGQPGTDKDKARKSRRKRKKAYLDDGTVELLQDFTFPVAGLRMRGTADGEHIYATGIHKPVVRCWDVRDMALKFERHQDSENVDFMILTQDWTKFVGLQMDGRLEFHNQGGIYHNVHVPIQGRALAYHSQSCDLMTVGRSNLVYRLNLNRGQFMAPYETDLTEGINAAAVCSLHQLMAFCGDGVEFYDPRVRKRVAVLSIDGEESVSTCSFEQQDGLSFAVGTESGKTLLYDVRGSKPVMTKDLGNDEPIQRLTFVKSSFVKALVCADKRAVRIYDLQSQDLHTGVEPPSPINDMYVYPNSGLIFLACEQPEQQTYYAPSLGAAPSWCAYLDSMTEELEEAPRPAFYDNYKFMTLEALKEIGLDEYVGTSLLRPYMHGYFIDIRLYRQAQSRSRLEQQEEKRKEHLQQRLDQEAQSRVVKSTDQKNAHDERFKAVDEGEDFALGDVPMNEYDEEAAGDENDLVPVGEHDDMMGTESFAEILMKQADAGKGKKGRGKRRKAR